jgi:hypothetical protein
VRFSSREASLNSPRLPHSFGHQETQKGEDFAAKKAKTAKENAHA